MKKELDGGICPAGFFNSIEGCKAFQTLPPIAICPDNSHPSYAGSNFALNQRSTMVCEIVRYSKGRVWCPKGFNIIFPPDALDKYEFGEEIPEEEAYKMMSGMYESKEIPDEIVQDIFTSFDELSEDRNRASPVDLNSTKIIGPDTDSNSLFASSNYSKNSQANIQMAEMRGMGIKTESGAELSGSEFHEGPKSCLKDKKFCGDPRGLRSGEFEHKEGSRWEKTADSGSNIMLRRLQGMAMGGTLETQMFQPGLEKELEYGPLSGLYEGNYGNIFGKASEEEILISSNIGQIMGNGQFAAHPLAKVEKIQEINKEPTCSLIVAVHSTNCTPLQCKSPFLKEVNHILRDWAVFVLQADPDSGSNLIPNGKDLPFTNPG